MKYEFIVKSDLHAGYMILRKPYSSSSNEPYHQIAKIDDKKDITFSQSLSPDEEKEIEDFAKKAGIL